MKGDGATVDDANALRQAMELFLSSLGDFMGATFIHKYFPSKVVNNMDKGLDRMRNVTKKYSTAYLDKLKKSGNTEIVYGQPLLEQWLIEGKMTEENAVKSAGGMLAAGVDTVGPIIYHVTYHFYRLH